MAARSGPPRIHRLPQRLDYALIPAPLDLSLPIADEKSPLPAIIVTPSSPSSSRDFSIAFLAPPLKPTIRERVASYFTSSKPQGSYKARGSVVLALLFFVLACHVLAYRLAVTRNPHLQFNAAISQEHFGLDSANVDGAGTSGAPFSWLDLGWLLGTPSVDGKREFVVREFTQRDY